MGKEEGKGKEKGREEKYEVEAQLGTEFGQNECFGCRWSQ